MTFLKYALGLVAILSVVFLLIGALVPTFSYESRIIVDAPREHSFAVFSDETRMGDWLSHFKSIELVSGAPNEVGSEYRLVIVEKGEKMVMTETVKAFDENEFYAFELDNDVMLADVEIRFSGDETSTEIVATTKVNGKNFLWRSILPLFKSMMTQRAQHDYDKLKHVIETTPAPSSVIEVTEQ